MALQEAKQINYPWLAPVNLSGVAFAAGATADIAAALTAAAGSAGRNGASVPVQASVYSNIATSVVEGFQVSGSSNRVEVWDNTTKTKLADTAGNEIYGRLTNAGAVYTLSLYSLVAGVETAYTAAAALTLDLAVPYLFKMHNLPLDALMGGSAKQVNNDPAGGSAKFERLAVTATDTVAALAIAPNTSKLITLYVNGKAENSVGSPAPFTVAGTTVTWSATNAGYSLATTDEVIAVYSA